jgi:uncharacterized protein YggE
MKKIIVSLLLLTLPYVATAQPELKGSPEELRGFLHPNANIIKISDRAEETAYSDVATVNLIITTDEKLLSAAMKRNSVLRANIGKELVAVGIKPIDIKNSKFSSSPEYGWFGKKPESYKVINRLAIRVSEESQLEKIAEISDKHPESTLSGVSFEHSKKDEFTAMVKERALQKVLTKKAYYEKSLGVKLVPVSFGESDVGPQATDAANMVEEVVVTGMRQGGSSYSLKREASPSRPTSSFDEVKYQAIIWADFRVE